MKKLLIIAGGTGGHIFPALTIADYLKAQNVSIFWMGAEAGMEKQLVADRYPLYLLPVKGLRGKNLIEKLKTPFRLIKSVFLAYHYIQKIQPDVVLGMGGYASGPGGLAAKLARVPLVIHEQNALPGLTNKVLSKIATKTLQAFPSAFSKNAVTVGNPVRASIVSVKRSDDYYRWREKPWKILVLGGSQGARFINQLLMDFIKLNPDGYLVWHQTGKNDVERVRDAYAAYPGCIFRVEPFITTMDDAYAWADLVIARSGALTVAEVAMVGLPAIFIPFPLAVDDHQYRNALFLAKNGAAKVFRETEITARTLLTTLNALCASSVLTVMSQAAKQLAAPNAVEDIVTAMRK